MIRRWSSASIRVQLTAWYAAVLTLTLILYGTVTFLAVRHAFYEQLEDQLHQDFDTTEDLLDRAADASIALSDDERPDGDDDDDVTYDVWSMDGKELSTANGFAAVPPPVPPSRRNRFQSVAVNGRTWRTLTGTTAVAGQTVILRVWRSERQVRGELREILVALALGLPLVVVLAGGGGYVLARRALAPIDRLGSEAQRITAERLHERVSVPNPHDEIGRLAAVINDTLARLELSFERLRRFTADASHELRTPLAVIRGLGEAGVAQPRSASEYKDAIGSMLEEVDRVTSLVDTLLRLSHADAGTARVERQPVDAGDLAREVVASLGILAEERGQRIVVDAANPVPVCADRLVLREAVTNIIDNAIKYSPSGSSIDVSVRTDGSDAVVTVADEGPGIAVEHREQIFDRFFRIDEARSRDGGGAGLGLAIAKWAVEINGGRIAVDARPTGGAIFRIVLPLRNESLIS